MLKLLNKKSPLLRPDLLAAVPVMGPKSPKSQTCSQQRPWNPAKETKLAAPRPNVNHKVGVGTPKPVKEAHRECSHLPRVRGSLEETKTTKAWLWRAAGIVVRFHMENLGLLEARHGLEGNPAFPKSGSLNSHPTVFLIMNILFQSPGTPLGSVSGLGLIPVQNWAWGLAGSGQGYPGAHVGLDTFPQFLV